MTIQIDQLYTIRQIIQIMHNIQIAQIIQYAIQIYNKYDNKWFDDKNGFELTI